MQQVPPIAATALGTLAGAAAGAITGLLHTQFLVHALLAGVLTSTALYSVNLFLMGGGNLSLATADSIITVAERVGTRVFGLPASLTLWGTSVGGGRIAELLLMLLLACALALGLALFLGTDLGLAMRAAGGSPQMARAAGIDVNRMVVLGLGVSNGLIGLSGALLAQYEGFANIQMGIGAVVSGAAMLMVGETLLGKRPLWRWIAGAVAGALVFRLVVAAALRAGLAADALKLVTALLVLAVLVVPEALRRFRGAPAAESSGRG